MDEIEPMLRFCAYKSGKDTSKGVNVIAKEVAENKLSTSVQGWDELKSRLEVEGSREKKEQIEIRWRDEIVPVRNVELVDVAVKVQKVLASLEKDETASRKGGEGSSGKKKADGKKDILGARRMGTYDKALLVLSEAEQISNQLVEDNKVCFSPLASAVQASLTHSHRLETDRAFERSISSIRSIISATPSLPFLHPIQPSFRPSETRSPPHRFSLIETRFSGN